jgi:hypothetical protein
MIDSLLIFGGPILVTLVVAVLLCRYRYSHKKRIGFGTVVASAVIANVAVFMSVAFYEEGWHLFTREAWTGGKGGWEAGLFVLGIITVMCILPALGVAVYYERRSRRDTKSVASYEGRGVKG